MPVYSVHVTVYALKKLEYEVHTNMTSGAPQCLDAALANGCGSDSRLAGIGHSAVAPSQAVADSEAQY